MGEASLAAKRQNMGMIIRALFAFCVIACALALPSPNEVVPEDALVSYDDPYWMSGEYNYKEVEQGADIYSPTGNPTNRQSNTASWAMVKPGTECRHAEQEITGIDFNYIKKQDRKAAVSKCNAACTGKSQNFIFSGSYVKNKACYCEDKNEKQRLTDDGDCEDTTHNGYNLYKKSDAWVLETQNSECGGDEEHKGDMSLDMCAAACTNTDSPYRGFIFGNADSKCLTGSSKPKGVPNWCRCYCELRKGDTCTAHEASYDTYKFVGN